MKKPYFTDIADRQPIPSGVITWLCGILPTVLHCAISRGFVNALASSIILPRPRLVPLPCYGPPRGLHTRYERLLEPGTGSSLTASHRAAPYPLL
jgi:hypothetical protein